jgi:hypothetical protein
MLAPEAQEFFSGVVLALDWCLCHADAKRRQGCELCVSIIEIRMREADDLHDSCL